MKVKVYFLCLLSLSICSSISSSQNLNINYANRVNTLIGTGGFGLKSGNCYPGATYPFGMVQFTPTYFSKNLGFVINQLNGAGCEHMGNFPTFPLKGKLKISPDNILNSLINLSKEEGHAGYYKAVVEEEIVAELTVTERTGMARYTYPSSEEFGTIIIGAGIAATDIQHAAIAITAPNKCEGYAEGGQFCGVPTPYKVYFAAEFDEDAVKTGIWKNDKLFENATFAEGENSGIYFTFDLKNRKQIQYKVGVSYVSVENAKENLRSENSAWNFEKIQNDAENKWNEYLSKIQVNGTNQDRITQFYTHLYHSFIHPNVCSDVNNEYMGADFKVHKTRSKHYTSFSNWDTYRTQIQLLSILDPQVASDIVISHQLFAEEAGEAYPRWVLANIETGIMQGDPTCILISNAFAFGARNYNPKPVFRLMQRNAEIPGLKCQNVEVRPGLKQYLEKGYYNASIQLEYTSADFAIGQFALRAVGDEFSSWKFFETARSWKNLFNPETSWLQSRNPDGSWKPLTEDFRESTYKNYFWMVPYNLHGLIELIGGKKDAEKRLDELFVRLDAGYNDPWFAAGNEPSFHIPWIYNWVGCPYKTQLVVNRIINEQYSSANDGLPGNDDLGTMGAWYVFSCIGLYPEIPGIGGFAINTPIFESIKIKLKNGDLIINGGSEKNIYIKSLKINDKVYDKTWIDWNDLSNGAILNFKTTSKPNLTWGTKMLPPSFP
ncbi:MAG TPA: GH92 family glycosyl hydrolase [Paludibacteraceae bacterium]|nr:GH92 family glycosyl hydrolase [Paludibacteraceae bacterium]HOK99936.1 GH92 family glycosyl hydrolase [Paludibacteraceae bacterium]HPO66729.1 GH92 family glycosyl hydrolase [Paludibacteraceae bacterium]